MEQEVVEQEVAAPEVDTPPAEAQKAETVSQEHMIPKSRLDEALAAKRSLEKQLAEQENARKQAEKKALEEQGQFKQLYEEARLEAERVSRELEESRVNQLRRDIATEAGYPTLWNRISGNDEETLRADMAQLISSIPPLKAPGLDGGTASGERQGSSNANKLSEAQRKQWAEELGVPYKYMPN